MYVVACILLLTIYICNNLPGTVYLHGFHSPANVQLAAEFSGVLYIAVFLTLPQSYAFWLSSSLLSTSVNQSFSSLISFPSCPLSQVGSCRQRGFRGRRGIVLHKLSFSIKTVACEIIIPAYVHRKSLQNECSASFLCAVFEWETM